MRSYSALVRMVARAIYSLNPTLARVVFELHAGQLHLFDCLLTAGAAGHAPSAAAYVVVVVCVCVCVVCVVCVLCVCACVCCVCVLCVCVLCVVCGGLVKQPRASSPARAVPPLTPTAQRLATPRAMCCAAPLIGRPPGLLG